MTEVTLIWKEHRNNLCSMFEKLLEEGALVDCTLAAEGKYVNVHKTILSAVSPYFELIFTQESENNPIVILTDIKFQELKAMIDFIYRGKVNVPEEFLADFVCAAESLQINGLGRDYIKNQKQNGTAMTYAKELPNHVSCIPLNQHLVNVVSGNESSGTATPSLEAVEEHMDFEGHSSISSQRDPLNSFLINQCSTSANVVDHSISSGLSHAESELNYISTSNSLCLETCVKREPTSEEDVKMEFVDCGEECVEEDASHCLSPSETTCKSTSSSRLVTAGGLQTDPLSSNAPYQSTSVREFVKSDQDLLGPVSSLQPISFPQQMDFLSVSTLPSTSGIDKGLEIATDDVKPRIEFSESCYKEFATEESAFQLGIYTSEAAGAGEAEVELSSEVDVGAEAEGAPSLGDATQLSAHARTRTRTRTRTHAAERRFVCDVCGKDFQTKDRLKVHIRTHTGERPFACRVCGKAFNQAGDVSRHVRTHTGERPYACLTCGATFTRPSRLKKHLCGKAAQRRVQARTHTGQRPFVCDVCGKDFRAKSNLKVHIRTHTGERPYACPTCGKAFAASRTLKAHLLAQHPSTSARTHVRVSPTTPDSSPRNGMNLCR